MSRELQITEKAAAVILPEMFASNIKYGQQEIQYDTYLEQSKTS